MLGRLLRGARAGEKKAAWTTIEGGSPFRLTSTDISEGATMPLRHVSRKLGGDADSPALSWSGQPEGTRQLLLVVEDVDVPFVRPMVHLAALVEPTLAGLPTTALNPGTTTAGVRLLKGDADTGYLPPEPIKGHGPHHYVFQLFALDAELSAEVSSGKEAVAAAAGHVVGRARLTGVVERA